MGAGCEHPGYVRRTPHSGEDQVGEDRVCQLMVCERHPSQHGQHHHHLENDRQPDEVMGCVIGSHDLSGLDKILRDTVHLTLRVSVGTIAKIPILNNT